MPRIEIEYPPDVTLSLGGDVLQIRCDAAKELAYHYFAEGRLSSGLAAKLAGMTRIAFLTGLAERGIPWVDVSPEELQHELESA